MSKYSFLYFQFPGATLTTARSEMKIGGPLSIDGRLFVKGNLTVKGDVHLQPGSELVVTGRRTIHGSIKQAKVV